MNNGIKIDFDIIEERQKYLLLKTDENQYIIAKETEKNEIKKIEYNKFTYFSKFIFNNKTYEIIKINNNSEMIALKIFKIISEFEKDIPSSISEINNIFSLIKNNISLQEKRGLFAELYSILNYNLKPKSRNNSIYDMLDEFENDVEIKSYSKVKKEFKISYQQLSNNQKAYIYLFCVEESSEGNTIKEIYEKLEEKDKERYCWIEFINHDGDTDKFVINKDPIIRKINYYSNGLTIPEKCKDAVFTFEVD